MSGQPLPPTLDQLAIFLAIVETGSFAAAARKLGRATSVISYAVANLESQLGVTLFRREGTRTPVLTEAGHAILADSRAIAIAMDGLLAKARGLTSGLEAEVSLVVDVMLPAKKLVKALDDFRRTFPTVALRLRVEALGAVTQTVLSGQAVFGISGPLELASDLLARGPAGSVKLVPVAAPGHPLASMPGPVSAAAAKLPVSTMARKIASWSRVGGRGWPDISKISNDQIEIIPIIRMAARPHLPGRRFSRRLPWPPPKS